MPLRDAMGEPQQRASPVDRDHLSCKVETLEVPSTCSVVLLLVCRTSKPNIGQAERVRVRSRDPPRACPGTVADDDSTTSPTTMKSFQNRFIGKPPPRCMTMVPRPTPVKTSPEEAPLRSLCRFLA